MKNQIITESWDPIKGIYILTISNKWGIFSAKAICSQQDYCVMDSKIGKRLCQYKIWIKILKAKAKAFNQRAIGIKHAHSVITNIQKQNVYLNDNYMKLNLLCCADTMRNESRRIKKKIKELETNYPFYAEYLIKAALQQNAKFNQGV